MKVTHVAAALSLCLAAPWLLAENDERWYQVEVLIFENPDYGAENPEQWPTYPSLESRSEYLEVGGAERQDPENSTGDNSETGIEVSPRTDANGLPQAFMPLTEVEYQLTRERENIEDRRGFRILYHQAWIQPVPDRDEVLPIRIEGGETYGQQPELRGYLNLYVERYLHLTTDLQLVRYTQTDNPFRLIDEDIDPGDENRFQPFNGLSLLTGDTPESAVISDSGNRYHVATESIRMEQRRRMRSSELHYLDNPEFGLLFLVTPIQLAGEG